MNRTRISHLIALPATVLVLAGVTAATPIAIAAATPTANAGTARSAADQVRTAERTLLRAAVDGDTHTAGALLAPDLQQIDVTGTRETRADYLATIGGGVDFVTLKPIKPISVRVYGNHAVTRVKLKFKVIAGGQTVQHEGWTTDLWRRHDGRWKLVWSQSTAIPHHLDLFIQSLQP
jgi:ketosteroid isomerase-like protein